MFTSFHLDMLDGPTAWTQCQDIDWLRTLIDEQTMRHGLLPNMHWRFAELVRQLTAATCRTAGLRDLADTLSALDPIRDTATAQRAQLAAHDVWKATCRAADHSRHDPHRHRAVLSAAGTAQALNLGVPAAIIADARIDDPDPAKATTTAFAAAVQAKGTEEIPSDPHAAAYCVAEAVQVAAGSAAMLIPPASVCDMIRSCIDYTDLPPAVLPRPKMYATFDEYVRDFPDGEYYRRWLAQYPNVRLIHGTGPHSGLPGGYLWAAVLGCKVVVNDRDDGMVEKVCATAEEAISELDLLGELAPFGLYELADFGYSS